jgi:hypothetical protein
MMSGAWTATIGPILMSMTTEVVVMRANDWTLGRRHFDQGVAQEYDLIAKKLIPTPVVCVVYLKSVTFSSSFLSMLPFTNQVLLCFRWQIQEVRICEL